MLPRIVRGGASKTLKLLQPVLGSQQHATIMGKAFRGCPIERPPPYPYKDKPFLTRHSLFDTTLWRFNENSKVIVVDGPIACGKTSFAKALAEDLEMYHFPEVTMDDYYINSYGYDHRLLDPQLPDSCKSFDVRNFCENPTHRHAGFVQIMMFMLRYSQYIDALAHILNTGQGVILERSPYSDFVFLESMIDQKYISQKIKKLYYDLKKNSMRDLLRPHLVIYLDVPDTLVAQKIQNRSISYEVNSKALTPAYLHSIETHYKQDYLKEASIHSELLVYDWSEGGEVESVIEDIERIDFEAIDNDKMSIKAVDWKVKVEFHLTAKRIQYTSMKNYLLHNMNVPNFDVPELRIPAEEFKLLKDVWFAAPGMKYARGYNKDQGDRGIIMKHSQEHVERLS